MNKTLVKAAAALSLCFAVGCVPGGSNPTSLSNFAYIALVKSGLFVKEGEIFTTKYHEGYNLNFEISVEEAQELLPDGFTPLPLRIVESDAVDKYYLSMYMAVIEVEVGDPVTRIDLFTYSTDLDGERALQFVSSYISVPQRLIKLGMLNTMYEIFDYFAKDSATGLPAYPHYYTETLTADSNTFNLEYTDYEGLGGTPYVRLITPDASALDDCNVEDEIPTGRFTNVFITANSQIYRNGYDKNVNYFNQEFMEANVKTKDLDCIEHNNLAGLHPMLSIGNLVSVQFYGDPTKEITWFYQTCSYDDCSNPF